MGASFSVIPAASSAAFSVIPAVSSALGAVAAATAGAGDGSYPRTELATRVEDTTLVLRRVRLRLGLLRLRRLRLRLRRPSELRREGERQRCGMRLLSGDERPR
mmetsp:Transcript_34681/g.103675  ORF Transcript_34681/g.103675 Transcript_34681/m.103675 type:complete len:104 (-) Transcript_34681:1433-1744(-)